MEESIPEKKDYIKVLNPEKVLEFKKNDSNLDEAEIVLENIDQENIIISKIYINNFTHFKCSPNIIVLNKNSTKKIKVIVDDNNYKVSNSDIFLVISHPIKDQENVNDMDDKKLNDYFKGDKSFKENGQKLYLIGYKKEDKKSVNISKDDKLLNKIRELEKQVFEHDEKTISQKKEEKEVEINEKTGPKQNDIKNYNKNNNLYIYLGLFFLIGSIILYKLFKK